MGLHRLNILSSHPKSRLDRSRFGCSSIFGFSHFLTGFPPTTEDKARQWRRWNHVAWTSIVFIVCLLPPITVVVVDPAAVSLWSAVFFSLSSVIRRCCPPSHPFRHSKKNDESTMMPMIHDDIRDRERKEDRAKLQVIISLFLSLSIFLSISLSFYDHTSWVSIVKNVYLLLLILGSKDPASVILSSAVSHPILFVTARKMRNRWCSVWTHRSRIMHLPPLIKSRIF